MSIREVRPWHDEWDWAQMKPVSFLTGETRRRVGKGHWLDRLNRWHTCYLVYSHYQERLLVDSEDCLACQQSGWIERRRNNAEAGI